MPICQKRYYCIKTAWSVYTYTWLQKHFCKALQIWPLHLTMWTCTINHNIFELLQGGLSVVSPSPTMASGMDHPRKISFVLQEDIQAFNSNQSSTLQVKQVNKQTNKQNEGINQPTIQPLSLSFYCQLGKEGKKSFLLCAKKKQSFSLFLSYCLLLAASLLHFWFQSSWWAGWKPNCQPARSFFLRRIGIAWG